MNEFEMRRFLEAAFANGYELEFLSTVDREKALHDIEIDFKNALALNQSETLQRRHDWFNIAGATLEDYRERVLDLGDQRQILAGIRHVGGNVEKPFVHVWANFPVQTQADVDAISNAVAMEFKVFRPRMISLFMRPKEALAGSERALPARLYVVGRVSELIRAPLPLGYERIELRSPQDDSYFGEYERIYFEFHERQPELKDRVSVNDREEMEEAREQGLLREVRVDGKKAGYISGVKSAFLGLSGLYFTELLLSHEFKGQGLASALQRKYIDTVATDFDVVWGTIDAQNLPSLRTAFRVGRKVMRGEYFFEL